MTEQQKAEAYVREKMPELMKLSFGCRYLDVDDAKEYTVVHRNDVYDRIGGGKNEVWSVPNFEKGYQADWRFGVGEGYTLQILGHPIQLQHWLRVLGKQNPVELYFIEPHNLEVAIGELFDTQKVYFDLTTGQPATEADYKAFNDIIGV
jgi:hypothetical protein